jgi:hypothetical protein
LVRSDLYTERHISHAIETRSSCRRHDPVNIPRMARCESYSGGACLARIGPGWRRAGNSYASQVVAISVKYIHRDVCGAPTSVEYIEIGPRTTACTGQVRWCADPNIRRSATGSGRTRRTWRARRPGTGKGCHQNRKRKKRQTGAAKSSHHLSLPYSN